SHKEVSKKEDIGTGPFGLIGNIIWLLVAGFWLAIGHIVSGLLCCITIIGIPFGLQHFKLVQISLMPIGMTIVKK
ncbi:MAG: YccF domain-containing protein, partial [Methylophilus sp.]